MYSLAYVQTLEAECWREKQNSKQVKDNTKKKKQLIFYPTDNTVSTPR